MGYFSPSTAPLVYEVTATAPNVCATGKAVVRYVLPIGLGAYLLPLPSSSSTLGMVPTEWFRIEKNPVKARSYHSLTVHFEVDEPAAAAFAAQIAECVPFSVDLVVSVDGQVGQILKVDLSG